MSEHLETHHQLDSIGPRFIMQMFFGCPRTPKCWDVRRLIPLSGPHDMNLDTETENVLPPDVWHGVLWYLGAAVVGGWGCRAASNFKECMGLLPAQRTWTVHLFAVFFPGVINIAA